MARIDALWFYPDSAFWGAVRLEQRQEAERARERQNAANERRKRLGAGPPVTFRHKTRS